MNTNRDPGTRTSERELRDSLWRWRSAERGLRRREELRRAEYVDERPNVALDSGRNPMRCLGRRADDARPVTQDAVKRAFLGGRPAPDAVCRRVVRDEDGGARRIVAVVFMWRRRPRGKRGEREERQRGNRTSPRAEPPQHQTISLASDPGVRS